MKKTMISIALAAAVILPSLGQTVFTVGTNAVVTESTPDLTDAMGVSAGASHALAVCLDGCVVAWGADTNGQCDVPSDLSEDGTVIAVTVSGGKDGSVAVDADGNLWSWGSGSLQAIAACTSYFQTAPFVDAQTGVSNLVTLTDDGTVQATTYMGESLQSYTNVASITTCNDGRGYRYGAVLNIDTNDPASVYNIRLVSKDSFLTNIPPQVSNTVQLVLWTNGAVALKADGTAWRWGNVGSASKAQGIYVGLSGGSSSVYGVKADGSQVWLVGQRLDGTNALPASIVPLSAGSGFGVGISGP